MLDRRVRARIDACPTQSRSQRLNGRLAMLGFVGIMLAEKSSKIGALEQFGGDFLGVALLSITLTLASVFPKFASGSSLKVRARMRSTHAALHCAVGLAGTHQYPRMVLLQWPTRAWHTRPPSTRAPQQSMH